MKFTQSKYYLGLPSVVKILTPVLVLVGGVTLHSASAQTVLQTNTDYAATPPITSREAGNVDVMLTLSVDHQLFIEAYNDYDDLTGDGTPETTYTHAVDYVGYFNNHVCYQYEEPVSGNGQHFKPISEATDKYCTDGGWSGNFLNWVSMTRIDLIRQVLYGGYRSTDEANKTILERSFLPQDTHSFAKYYNGNDIENLTDNLPDNCDDDYASEEGASCAGYTFCNTSEPDGVNLSSGPGTLSQDSTSAPWIRAVQGNYSLWASNERFQCVTREEIPRSYEILSDGIKNRADSGDSRLRYILRYGVNGNNPVVSGIEAFSYPPSSSEVRDFVAKVSVCEGTDLSAARCKSYGDSQKPYGLLQDESFNDIRFGLITGSYVNNKDFGVIRKHISTFSDSEVGENGVFLNPSAGSIVSSLNALRLVDYTFNTWTSDESSARSIDLYSGTYRSHDVEVAHRCDWGLGGFDNGECRNWGNPFAELLADSYRYFAGANAPYNPDGQDLGDIASESELLGGLTVSNWSGNPYYVPPSDTQEDVEELECTSRNVLAFNASGVSYDNSLDGLTPANLGIGSENTQSLNQLLDNIIAGQSGENLLTSQTYFVGTSSESNNDGQCSAKEIQNLSDVEGVCPETPRLEGTYFGSALSYVAHTQDVNPNTDGKETVSTFGVTLAGALPNITIDKPNGGEVVIIPACRNLGNSGNGYSPIGNCALVEFRPIESADGNAYKYYVGWEDSEQGGDYDLDLSGSIEVNVNNDAENGVNISIDTNILYESAYDAMLFGFSISGTGGNDGVYFPSRVKDDNPDTDDPELGGAKYQDYEAALFEAYLDGERSIDEFKALSPVEANTNSGGFLSGQGQVNHSGYELCAASFCENVDSVTGDSVDGDSRRQRVTLSLVDTDEDTNVGKFLKDPLYYAVKWGSFDYSSSEETPVPGDPARWASDEVDSFGDPMPKGYASITAPQRLFSGLKDIIDGLVSGAVTGTGSGVATNTLTGEGLSLQTFYYPMIGDAEGQGVAWTGSVSGLFTDRYGNLREDSNNNGVLDNPVLNDEGVVTNEPDKAVEFYVDSSDPRNKRPRARLYDLKLVEPEDEEEIEDEVVDPESSDEEEPVEVYTPRVSFVIDAESVEEIELDELNYVWDANRKLNAISDFTAQKQDFSPGNGRRILSAIPTSDLLVEDEEESAALILTDDHVEDFVVSESDDNPFTPYFDIPGGSEDSALTADNLTNFIRGEEGIAGARSRTLDEQVYRLGDVMHSTPKVVGRPTSSYRTRYSDASYQAYENAHSFRRQVAYVGGNDGMLHAFNLGFFDPSTTGFYDGYNAAAEAPFSNAGLNGNPNTLGSELWAYVPFNLLPHLKWLADPQYQHVYYVDGPIQTFDAKIFEADNTHHINGWGTILVARMRFGGGPYAIEGEDLNVTSRSAYIIFDVTNPLNPELLAEITHPELGFTTSNVDVMVRRNYAEGDGARNDWYLVFGSGPTDMASATSDQTAKLFYLNLADLQSETDSPSLEVVDTNIANSFVGGLTVADWGGNYQSDAVYFGVVGDGTDGNRGALMASHINFGSAGNILAANRTDAVLEGVDQPFSAPPITVTDNEFNHWVFAGTGRFLVDSDLDNNNQNTLYGLRVEASGEDAVNVNDLYDVSNLKVYVEDSTTFPRQTRLKVAGSNGNDTDLEIGGELIDTVDKLKSHIDTQAGWMRNYNNSAEMNFLPAAFLNDTVISDTFRPAQSAVSCEADGTSYKYILDMFTGMPQTRLRTLFFRDNAGVLTQDGTELTELEAGSIEAGGLVVDSTAMNNVSTAKLASGEQKKHDLTPPNANPRRQSWREIPLEGVPN